MFNLVDNFKNLGRAFYSNVTPETLLNTKLLNINADLLKALNLNDLSVTEIENIFIHGKISDNYIPIATVYAGHQFGVRVPQLGDGRAMLIGEHAINNKIYELQLKGSGKTPYSRMGDGRAVVRSSIREYLGSIAMLNLGIASTDVLAIATSATPVYREEIEKAALVLRIAESFIRFGHFEYFANQNRTAELQQLANFVIKNYYPKIDIANPNAIYDFFAQVVAKTAVLIAKWQSVGFVHGVMNSDNMSILGLTLDYGPYAFMDKFIPNYIYNHSDDYGRYTYQEQVNVAYWNLERLMDALYPIAPNLDKLKAGLMTYIDVYNTTYLELMSKKLGFNIQKAEREGQYNNENCHPGPNPGSTVNNVKLIQSFLELLYKYQMDWTFSFRQLSYGQTGVDKLKKTYKLEHDFEIWHRSWQSAILEQCDSLDSALLSMQKNNPCVVPRTSLLQKAITDVDNNNYASFNLLLKAIKHPFFEYDDCKHLYDLPKSTDENICLSCSS